MPLAWRRRPFGGPVGVVTPCARACSGSSPGSTSGGPPARRSTSPTSCAGTGSTRAWSGAPRGRARGSWSRPPACPTTYLPWLARELHPLDDLRAAVALSGIVRRWRPDVVHTHLAKAGALGRSAAFRSHVPVVVHTFHGHVLQDYFSRMKNAAFARVERGLATRTDALIAVSPWVRDELLAMGIGDERRWHVVPVGVDLDAIAGTLMDGAQARRRLDLPRQGPVVTVVGRLVAHQGSRHLPPRGPPRPGPASGCDLRRGGRRTDARGRGAGRAGHPGRRRAVPGMGRGSSRALRRVRRRRAHLTERGHAGGAHRSRGRGAARGGDRCRRRPRRGPRRGHGRPGPGGGPPGRRGRDRRGARRSRSRARLRRRGTRPGHGSVLPRAARYGSHRALRRAVGAQGAGVRGRRHPQQRHEQREPDGDDAPRRRPAPPAEPAGTRRRPVPSTRPAPPPP